MLQQNQYTSPLAEDRQWSNKPYYLSNNNKIYNSIITTFCSSGAIHMMDMGKCITTTTMVHPTNIMIATMNQCTERLMKKQLFINQNHINQNHTNQNHLISQNQAILRLWYRKWNQPKINFIKFTLDIFFTFQKMRQVQVFNIWMSLNEQKIKKHLQVLVETLYYSFRL